MLNGKSLAIIFIILISFVTVSGCADLYNILQTYVPTVTPDAQAHVRIGDVAPKSSAVNGVTFSGSGDTITIRGRGQYNVNAHNDYFTLNQGNADIYINLQDQGAICAISMDYTSPVAGFVSIYQSDLENMKYKHNEQVYLPYTTQYCLMVNWHGNWEIRITQ